MIQLLQVSHRSAYLSRKMVKSQLSLRTLQSRLSMTEIRKIIKQLSEYFLAGDVSARAYAWLAESIVASSDAYESDSVLTDFADLLASYSPTEGEGLFGYEQLRFEATKLRDMLHDGIGL